EQSILNDVQESLLRLTQLTGKRQVLDEARNLIRTETSTAAIERLSNLWQVIESLGMTDSFEIDLADVSSLDYYTGLSFKVFVRGVGYRVGRGGRYDSLTASFGKNDPAVGFVLNLDSLVEVLGKEVTGNGGNGKETHLIDNQDTVATFAEAIKRRKNNEQIE